MIVNIRNVSGKGWSNYVLKDREKATLILGNVHLGDTIVNSLNYKSGNAVNFVVSFSKEDNISIEQGREIVKEFFNEFMQGFNEDEYHLDIVEHRDANHLHYHARIPKINLVTNTQLKPYWHKSDLGFKTAVIDKIALKYNLNTGEIKRRLTPNKTVEKIERISNWRDKHKQPKLDFSSKRGRADAEKQLNDYISSLIASSLINNLDEVKRELQALGLDVVNAGYDKKNDFYYLTVENESGKIRIKGDIYNEQFFGLAKEDRAKAIRDNESPRGRKQGLESFRREIEERYRAELQKRLKFIDRQYGKARKKAYSKNAKKPREYREQTREISSTSNKSEIFRMAETSYTWSRVRSRNAGIFLGFQSVLEQGDRLIQKTKRATRNNRQRVTKNRELQRNKSSLSERNITQKRLHSNAKQSFSKNSKGALRNDTIRATINRLTRKTERRARSREIKDLSDAELLARAKQSIRNTIELHRQTARITKRITERRANNRQKRNERAAELKSGVQEFGKYVKVILEPKIDNYLKAKEKEYLRIERLREQKRLRKFDRGPGR